VIDLSAYGRDGDIHLISPPQQFEGGEEAYDAHIGGARNPDLLRPGRGAWQLVTRHAERPVTSWLEIGAVGVASFLKQHHRVSANGMIKLRESLFPIFKRLDHVFTVGDGAAILGSFAFCK
jgi:hypothetical protein